MRVERDTLIVEGDVEIALPEQMQAVYAHAPPITRRSLAASRYALNERVAVGLRRSVCRRLAACGSRLDRECATTPPAKVEDNTSDEQHVGICELAFPVTDQCSADASRSLTPASIHPHIPRAARHRSINTRS